MTIKHHNIYRPGQWLVRRPEGRNWVRAAPVPGDSLIPHPENLRLRTLDRELWTVDVL